MKCTLHTTWGGTLGPLQFRLRHVSMYRGAGKSLALPTSRCILFDGENISFDAIYEGESNENLKSGIKIRNTA